MKISMTVLIALLGMSIRAQQPLDTIYANEQKNVALFFSSPIRQAITGSSHFVFTYNREKQQYFGLLQAQPGAESNLLAITMDGQVYSYILKYAPDLISLNYFIPKEKSIGNEKPLKEKEKPKNKNLVKRLEGPKEDHDRVCNDLLKLKQEAISTKRKKGIVLKLLNLEYHKDYMYMVFGIKNTSGIDFEIDYLDVNTVNGNNKRKASFQRLKQEVLYRYHMPRSIADGHGKRFVYVLPKTVLGKEEKLMVELQELHHGRKVVLSTRL